MTAKILVVDDSPEVLVMLHQFLRAAGYDVLLAATFEDGRRLARHASPDVIVVDVRLGAYNGLELAVIERVDHPSRPLIVMSGHLDSVLRADATNLGAATIEKPFDGDQLLRLIESMLTKRDASIVG